MYINLRIYFREKGSKIKPRIRITTQVFYSFNCFISKLSEMDTYILSPISETLNFLFMNTIMSQFEYFVYKIASVIFVRVYSRTVVQLK